MVRRKFSVPYQKERKQRNTSLLKSSETGTNANGRKCEVLCIESKECLTKNEQLLPSFQLKEDTVQEQMEFSSEENNAETKESKSKVEAIASNLNGKRENSNCELRQKNLQSTAISKCSEETIIPDSVSLEHEIKQELAGTSKNDSDECLIKLKNSQKKSTKTHSRVKYSNKKKKQKEKNDTALPLNVDCDTVEEHKSDLSIQHEQVGLNKKLKRENVLVPYELAEARNALRLKHQIETGEFIPGAKYEDRLGKKDARTKQQKKFDEQLQEIKALDIARKLCEISVEIQEALVVSKMKPDETKALKLLQEFYDQQVTPLALKHVPHIVDTVKKCKGYMYNKDIRKAANKCYNKCQAMFAVPEGETFETVYIAGVEKLLSKELKEANLTDVLEELRENSFDVHPDSDWESDTNDGEGNEINTLNVS